MSAQASSRYFRRSDHSGLGKKNNSEPVAPNIFGLEKTRHFNAAKPRADFVAEWNCSARGTCEHSSAARAGGRRIKGSSRVTVLEAAMKGKKK